MDYDKSKQKKNKKKTILNIFYLFNNSLILEEMFMFWIRILFFMVDPIPKHSRVL